MRDDATRRKKVARTQAAAEPGIARLFEIAPWLGERRPLLGTDRHAYDGGDSEGGSMVRLIGRFDQAAPVLVASCDLFDERFHAPGDDRRDRLAIGLLEKNPLRASRSPGDLPGASLRRRLAAEDASRPEAGGAR